MNLLFAASVLWLVAAIGYGCWRCIMISALAAAIAWMLA